MTALPPALRDVAFDLRWHWATREADSGLRSSHAALVAMIQVGASGSHARSSYDGAMVARCDEKRAAQERHKVIETALAKISDEHRSALWLAYGPHVVDPRALGALHGLGEAAPVAVLTAAARRAHASAAKRGEKRALWPWLLTRKASGAVIVSVSTEALALLRAALTTYAATAGVKVEPKARRSRATTKRVTAETFSPVWA